MLKILKRSLCIGADNKKYDIVVVGGGILGTASAREILIRHPQIKLALVEKENRLAKHQSGNNSGVIHTGLYYRPGSIKAKLCIEGMNLLYQYLDEYAVPYKKVGKLVVATNNLEVKRLHALWERAQENKCPDIQLIQKYEIKEYEPFCRGIEALWSPNTGIVDYNVVTQFFAHDVTKYGGDIILNFKVNRFAYSATDPDYPVHILTKDNRVVATKYVLTCAGLHSDQIAGMTGCSKNPKIIPIRGEYLKLNKSKCHMIKGNIYSVPEPGKPFSGVHFTPRLNEDIWIGPNAVLAFKREGYHWAQFNIIELCDSLFYSGFLKMVTKHRKSGIDETAKSMFKTLQAKSLQKYIPSIKASDLTQCSSGVYAQAVDEHGNIVDDFVFDQSSTDNIIANNVIHCRNAPSPAATSSMAVAKFIVDKIDEQFKLESINLNKIKSYS